MCGLCENVALYVILENHKLTPVLEFQKLKKPTTQIYIDLSYIDP